MREKDNDLLNAAQLFPPKENAPLASAQQPRGDEKRNPKTKKQKLVLLIGSGLLTVLVVFGAVFAIQGERAKTVYTPVVCCLLEDNGAMNATEHNGQFPLSWGGMTSGSALRNTIDAVIKNNEQAVLDDSNGKLVTLALDDNLLRDSESLKALKQTIHDADSYVVSFEYDNNQYINKIIVRTLHKEDSSSSHMLLVRLEQEEWIIFF